jgi:hypothetical protein
MFMGLTLFGMGWIVKELRDAGFAWAVIFA